jgi:hypothetical protein
MRGDFATRCRTSQTVATKMAAMQDEQPPPSPRIVPPGMAQHQLGTDERSKDGLIPISQVIDSGIARKSLFKAASDELVELLFPVHYPRKPVLFPLRTTAVTPEVGALDALHTPSYLVLEPSRCESYANQPNFPVREARIGYMRSSGTIPLRRIDARNVDG